MSVRGARCRRARLVGRRAAPRQLRAGQVADIDRSNRCGARSTLTTVALRVWQAQSRCWRSDATTLVRDLPEPANSRFALVARSRCVSGACAAPAPLSYTQLTACPLRLSADSVRCGSCRTTSADVPKQSELVYYHVRARPHASTPSSRRSSVGVHALPRRRVERPPQPTARPVWVGRRGWAAGEPAPSRLSGSAGDVGERMRRAESGGESGGPSMCDAIFCCVLLRFTWGVMFACPRYVVNARL